MREEQTHISHAVDELLKELTPEEPGEVTAPADEPPAPSPSPDE